MNLLKRLFGKKQNQVINQPKTPKSTSTFYYGGSHVAYDHNEDYNTRDITPPVYPWTDPGYQEHQVAEQNQTHDFGGYKGGDGGGAGADDTWQSNDYSPDVDSAAADSGSYSND